MGKIKSQGIANTIWSYLGIIAGGVYSIFLIPRAFDLHPEYWGIIQFLVYYMQVFLPLAQLGMPNTIIRFYSKVKEENKLNFYAFTISLTLIMTIVVSVAYFLFGTNLANSENKALFTGNYIWLIPMLIGAAFFETFASISKAKYSSKFPVFLKDSFPKLWTLALITVYWLHPFSFELFLALYALLYIVQFVLMTGRVVFSYQVIPKFSLSYFKSDLAKQMYPYMFFSLFVTSTALWSVKIDILMLGYLMDLQQVAFYSIALYMATLVVIPLRSMSSIATPMVAGFWTANQLPDIDTVLKKVSEVSLVTGSFIFLGLWFNIDWIMHILGSKFGDIKWVFFVIGLSRLVDSMFSINGSVILTSKFFRIDFYFQVILVITSILLNLWLIPVYQLEGAALATLAALLLYNLMKWVYLFNKFKFNPLTRTTWFSLGLILILVSVSMINPLRLNYWVNAVLSSFGLSLVYFVAIYYMKLSLELKEMIASVLSRFYNR